MKLRKTLTALFLAGTMVMGMGMSAMAADDQGPAFSGNGTETSPATASIRKHLEFAEGITVPTATFKFAITKVTEDAPDAKIEDISYSKDDALGTLTDGLYVLHKDSAITFGAFPHAGDFVYKIKETANTYPTSTNEQMNYSKEEYDLHVGVANGTNGKVYIQSIVATRDVVIDGEQETMKLDTIHFVNTYTKNASLTVEKKVEGDKADLGKDFDFEITFTKAASSNDNIFEGKIGNETVTCTAGQTKTFKLHHGQQLVFANLPAGTRYTVKEVGAVDHYTPSVIVVENGVSHTKTEPVDGAGVTTEKEGTQNCLVGEGTNSVVFTNTYHSPAPTGITMNNLPFLLLIAFGVCALGLLAVSKKRRIANR